MPASTVSSVSVVLNKRPIVQHITVSPATRALLAALKIPCGKYCVPTWDHLMLPRAAHTQISITGLLKLNLVSRPRAHPCLPEFLPLSDQNSG